LPIRAYSERKIVLQHPRGQPRHAAYSQAAARLIAAA